MVPPVGQSQENKLRPAASGRRAIRRSRTYRAGWREKLILKVIQHHLTISILARGSGRVSVRLPHPRCGTARKFHAIALVPPDMGLKIQKKIPIFPFHNQFPMKQLNLVLLILLGCYGFGLAQTEVKIKGPRPYLHRHSIQLELMGACNSWSLNYEGVFVNRPRFKSAIRVGANVADKYIRPGFYAKLRFPVMLYEQLSFGSHHLEVGAGILITNTFEYHFARYGYWGGRIFPLGALSAGYRFQIPERRWILKVAYTPMVHIVPMPYIMEINGFSKWTHAIGVTVGYAL